MASFSVRVLASLDDGYKGGDGSWLNSFSSLAVGAASPFTQKLAVRFNAVTIPQGATITSATLNFTSTGNTSATYRFKIYGIDEDDTANFTADPTGRSKTSAAIDWDASSFSDEVAYDTPDITTIVQEIVDRGGWASGNDMGFFVEDDGGSGGYADFHSYDGNTAKACLITINYSAESPSPSVTPSASISPSPSASQSPSSSISPSASASPSAAPTHLTVMKVAKPNVNVLTNSDPEKFKFSSEYGTLKYFDKEEVNISFTANFGVTMSASGTYTHSLGYYPYVEAFVRVYIGSPSGNYEYVPFAGAGATVLYSATMKITTTTIVLYGMIDGVSSSTWHFDFLLFVYKNTLSL